MLLLYFRCKNKNCLNQWTIDEKKGMLKFFSDLKSKDEQDLFLLRCCVIDTPIRKLDAESNKRPKMISVKYYLSFGVKKNVICRIGFMVIYGITKKRIERILKLLYNNEIPRDMRGKNVSYSLPGNLVADMTEFYLFI